MFYTITFMQNSIGRYRATDYFNSDGTFVDVGKGRNDDTRYIIIELPDDFTLDDIGKLDKEKLHQLNTVYDELFGSVEFESSLDVIEYKSDEFINSLLKSSEFRKDATKFLQIETSGERILNKIANKEQSIFMKSDNPDYKVLHILPIFRERHMYRYNILKKLCQSEPEKYAKYYFNFTSMPDFTHTNKY